VRHNLIKLQVNGFVKSSGYRINGGTSTQYLMADGTTSTSSGGGTVSASGLNTQIQQYNGVFGANVGFTFDKTNNDLVLGGTDTGIILKLTNEPATPAVGNIQVYAKV
jgi:hypothetical protein